MSQHPSLLRRLAGSLTIVQIAVVVATIEGFFLIQLALALNSGGPELDEYAMLRARDMLANSIVRLADGSAIIEPSLALKAYSAETPSFRFAALETETRRTLPGSSSELMKSLSHIDHIQVDVTKFSIVGDAGPHRTGNMRKVLTDAGEFVLVTYGFVFGFDDFKYQLSSLLTSLFSPQGIFVLSPLVLATLAICMMVARRSLAPLEQIVASARDVDMKSLHQRLPTQNVPIEVLPLVNAFNDALARVDSGVAQQRRFLANAAHELRTPVAILNARLDSPRKPTFEVDIKRDVRRIRNLIEQLLIMSRFSALPDESMQSVDLVALTQRQIADHTLLAIKSGRTINFEAQATQVLIEGNTRALESVIANLLENALHAEPEGGTVVVRITKDADLEVTDHGPGISEGDRELIFEAFWRQADIRPGTGLGLAIVKEIVEIHRGEISVDTTPGGGATFRVSFSRPR